MFFKIKSYDIGLLSFDWMKNVVSNLFLIYFSVPQNGPGNHDKTHERNN